MGAEQGGAERGGAGQSGAERSGAERDGLAGTRVALVLGTSAGGVGRHVRSVAAGLVERGARVVVFGPAATEELFGFTGVGARFAEVDLADRPRPVSDARAVARLRGLLRDADVVHAQGLRAGALVIASRASVAPRPLHLGRGPVPVVVTLHNAVIAGGRTAAIYGALERLVARGASAVLGVSPDLEERMRALGARRVGHALVPAPARGPMPGPEARGTIRAELGVGERPLIVTVARLADQKGLPTLLDASAGWGRRILSPLVVIAGDGPLEDSLNARIDAEDLPVRLLGRRSDVPALLAAADVAVMPSVWEGQPLILQEILRAGRPLVATRVGGVPGMVGGDGEAALLVPAGDTEALERAVSRVLDDPALAVRLGAAAAQRATALPTEDDAVAQLTELYRELVRR